MADVWRTRDRFGRDVTLTDAGMAHIVRRRPDMVGSQAAIKETVEAPERVMRDALHPDRECHYRRISDRRLLKVVIGYGAEGHGTVITAYPAPHVKRGEQQRWP